MPSQPSFPTDFRAIKSLERKYKGKTTRPVDQSKLRVKVKPTARKQPEIKTVPMPSVGGTLRTIGGIAANAPAALSDLAVSVPKAAYDYVRTTSPSGVISDVKSAASDFANFVRENPAEAFVETVAGTPKAAGELLREATLARDAGDEERAAQIEKLAVPMLLGSLIPGGRAAKGAGKTLRKGEKAVEAGSKAERVALKEKPLAAKPKTEKSTATPTKNTAQSSPFSITGKADMGQEVLRLKAKEMEVDPKLRTQPTGTEPVFDLSQAAYEETPALLRQTDPAVVQASLPRAQAGAEYPLGDRMRNVIDLTPQIAERLAEKAQQGRGTAQEYFYHTAPIVRGLEEIDVPQNEAIQFLSEKFAPAFAGTSPRTNTEQNLRNASLLMYLREKGVPISKDLYNTYGNARGYNMMGFHQDLAGQMFEGKHDPFTNPKPSSFLPNTAGDLGYVTADTHNIRGALLAMNEVEPGSIHQSWFRTPEAAARYAETAEFDPSKDIQDSLQSAMSGGRKMQVEYGPMADVTFEAARQSGIAPGPMQSLGWFGSGAETGLASATKTVAELMNERINVTAQALGLHPQTVLRLFQEGKLPLMAEGGHVDAEDLADKYGA